MTINIHYKIIETWPDDHLVVARYWTDVLTEEYLAADQNRYPDGTPVRCRSDISISLSVPPETGEELNKRIMSNAPLDWLKKLEAVKDPNTDTNIDHVTALIGQVKTVTEKDIRPEATIIDDSEIDSLLKALKN